MTAPRKADTWMPFYIADYLRKTMRLTRDQHGGYLLLLMAAWDDGGRLPNDAGTLAGITKASPAEWKKLAPVLLPFFDVDGDYLVQSRVVAEHAKAARLSEARSKSGSQGGRPRKQRESEQKPIAFLEPKLDETPLQEPIGSTLERSETNVSSLSPGKPERASPKAKTPIAEGFPGEPEIAEAADTIRSAVVKLDAADHAKRFRGHALTNDRRVADWGAAWRSWVEIEIGKAPPETGPKVEAPAFRWDGPAEVWDLAVLRMGLDKAAGYVGRCAWHDGALVCPSPTIAKGIRAELGRDLNALGYRLVEGVAA